MTRSRASAKQAGTSFETLMARFFATRLDDDRIERRTKNGRNDRGDLTGIRTVRGGRVVTELKDYGGVIHASEWLQEAEIERDNDDACVGVVIAKRRGTTNPAAQFVLMTAEDFAILLEGGDPNARSWED